MVVVIQALVILFTGAMEGMFRPGLQRIFTTLSPEPEGRSDRPQHRQDES